MGEIIQDQWNWDGGGGQAPPLSDFGISLKARVEVYNANHTTTCPPPLRPINDEKCEIVPERFIYHFLKSNLIQRAS